MDPKLIFLPVFLQVLLTFAIALWMARLRIREMNEKRIPAQDIRTRAMAAVRLEDSQPASDNYMNQFEMPVLFYVLAIIVYLTASVSWAMLVLLCLYVAARVVHSAIQLGRNNVRQRFAAFLVSNLFLAVGWIYLAVRIFA